jgi:hypothetical protein
MRQHLGWIAHASNAPQTGAFVEMIGLGSISRPTGLKSASTWSLGSGTA